MAAAGEASLGQQELHQVLGAFRQRQPRGVEQALVLAAEMARLATLWEERWAAGLQELQVVTLLVSACTLLQLHS